MNSAELEALLKEKIAQEVSRLYYGWRTGLGPRDRTVEVVTLLLTQEVPGIMEAARAFGQQRTPLYAMLSRGVAGFAEQSLVVTLPGSCRAQKNPAALLPGLVHLLDVLLANHTQEVINK
ncbi:MAG: molybdopterin-binding protein [Pseudomonadales bacterium]